MGPMTSPNCPKPTLPNADERLNTASRVELTVVEMPIDEAYRGMKKGGTSKGNVAIPDPKKRSINFGSLNNDLQ